MSELDTIPSVLPGNNPSDIRSEDTITVMQWNIGHFSLGTSKHSRVKDETFISALLGFQELLSQANADIVSLNEYSFYFANTREHPRCAADTVLFSDYQYKFLGNNARQRGYCFNAIFSTHELSDSETVEYEANKTASITSPSNINATDYYYLRSSIILFGEKVTFISTHLAFDNINNQVIVDQIQELIEALKDEEFVIICGDFNTEATNLTLFTEAGYSLANDGTISTYPIPLPYYSLDNIIVKGLTISHPRTIPALLSDHIPLVCEISRKENEIIIITGDSDEQSSNPPDCP